MNILVEGHIIDTKDIWKIEDISSSRKAGFIIHLSGNKSIEVSKGIPYESYGYEIRDYLHPYDRLRKLVEEKWEQDKSELPIFKL